MPELVVTASIIEESELRFVVVVSTAPRESDTNTHTDVEIGDAASLTEAKTVMRRLIGDVVDRAERRGDTVARVKRLLPSPAKS